MPITRLPSYPEETLPASVAVIASIWASVLSPNTLSLSMVTPARLLTLAS